jgi:hypothetical protein
MVSSKRLAVSNGEVMNRQHLTNAWWPQRSIKPLDALREVADCLETGQVAPKLASDLVARAIRQYLFDGKDLAKCLGLKASRGKKTLVSSERQAKRDGLIKTVFNGLSGGKAARSKQVVALLHGHPPGELITEADVMAHVLQLRKEHGRSLPRSWEQISRIAKKAE